jgi:hypothetical protein
VTVRESIKNEIDALPEDAIGAVHDFVLFQKYRTIFEMDDTTCLNSILGLMQSMEDGINAPLSECMEGRLYKEIADLHGKIKFADDYDYRESRKN